MDLGPTIGHRFLAQGPLASDFLEFRRVGGYPQDIVFAGLLQYIEHFLEESNEVHKRLFLSLVEDFKLESEQIGRLYELIQNGTDGKLMLSTEFLVGLKEATSRVMHKLNLQVNSDYQVLEAISGLAKALNCRGKVQFLIPGSFQVRRQAVIGERGPELMAIGASLDVFLLYDYMTKESFFVLTCGCLSLKYHIFADLQRAAQSCAKTVNELTAMNARCRRCEQFYRKSDIERVLSGQNEFIFLTKDKDCAHNCEWGIACMLCEFPMCGLCCTSRALTAKGPLCINCLAPYDEQIRASLCVHNYQWAVQSLSIAMRNRHLEYNEQKLAVEEKLKGGSTRTIPVSANLQYAPKHSELVWPSQTLPQPLIPLEAGPKPKICQGCSNEIQYSLCSAGCCCLFCAVSNIYSSSDLQSKCLYCLESNRTFLILECDCPFCNKSFKCSEMAFLCLRCGYQVCELCFLRINGQIPSCGKGQIPHKLNIRAKVISLEVKHSRSGLLSV